MLPNGLKLGYEIIDTCASEAVASTQLLEWLEKSVQNSTNLSPPLALVIGTGFSRTTHAIAPFLQQFGIPMIDYGSTSPLLSNKNRYPMYSRTVASDRFMAQAMAKLASDLGWKCVHLVYSFGQYGENGAEDVAQFLLQNGICLVGGSPMGVTIDTKAEHEFESAIEKIDETPNVRIIVCFCEDTTVRGLLNALISREKATLSRRKYFFVAGDFWGKSMDLSNMQSAAEGSITFQTNEQAGRPLSNAIGKNSSSLPWWINRLLENGSRSIDPWLKGKT